MKIAVLSGAGISAESGISTFRDIKDGLWYNYKIEEVATAEAWENNPEKVLEFHNMLRAKASEVQPNAGHLLLKGLETDHDVTIITQNVDNLHEKAGSNRIYHIHGELFKSRDSFGNIFPLKGDLDMGDLDSCDEQLRPHTVLFGEYPFNWEESEDAIIESDILIIVGTSFSISYIPSLVGLCGSHCKVFYVDPNPDPMIYKIRFEDLTVIPKIASIGLLDVVEKINEK